MALSATTLATGSADGNVRLWDLSNAQLPPVVLRGHTDAITSVAFDPASGKLASSSNDSTIRIWDVAWEKGGVPLAEAVCTRVWRNLTRVEWDQFVGADIPYEPTCPNLPSEPALASQSSGNTAVHD